MASAWAQPLRGSALSLLPGLRLLLRSIWTVLRLKERLVKLLMEHSHLHAAAQHSGANQVQLHACNMTFHTDAVRWRSPGSSFCRLCPAIMVGYNNFLSREVIAACIPVWSLSTCMMIRKTTHKASRACWVKLMVLCSCWAV